jgi:hypothetical protein
MQRFGLRLAVVENRLEEWRRLLRGSTTQARAILQRVLRGRIVFTPVTYDPQCIGYESKHRPGSTGCSWVCR